ncbi:MAG TPA: hypothetical protein PLH53_15560, partial [Ignavibacteriaceae bacterium]|nr:hypothetical protein [Ignavibacteriaceae bacterium]
MTKQLHPSDSSEQQLAHKEILSLLNENYQLKLESRKVLINDTLFQVDGYSENPPILCEIYSRIGKMKVAQHNKIGKDILKMLLIEKMHNKTFRKIIAFADEEAASTFSGGESWYSKLKDNFNIEIVVIDISLELKESLLIAQKRQHR